MADKKTNYAASLKAAPKKSSAPDKSKETVKVNIGGVITDIVRGSMSDEQWARVKQRAVKEMYLPVEISADEQPSKLKEDDKKQIKSSDIEAISRNLDTVADTIVSPEEKRLLGTVPPENRVKFLRERFVKRDYNVLDEPAPKTIETGAPKPDQGSPEEWKTMDSEQPRSPGTQTEDDQQVGSNTFSPLSQAMQMATGAAPSTVEDTNAKINKTSNEAMAALPGKKLIPKNALRMAIAEDAAANQPAPSGLDPAGSNPDLNAAAAKQANTKFYGQDGSPVDAGEPPQPGMLDTLNQNATQFRQAVTDVVTDPVGTMLPIIPMIGKGVGEMINQGGPFGSPAARAATQPPDAQPPAPQAPPPTGSTSLSASVKTPGKGAGFKSPDFENERNMLQEAYTTQNLANALLADQQSDLLTKKAELLRKRQDEEAALAARQAAMESARSERMKRGEAGLAQLQSRLMELENQSPDPNRFWNNKDAGQKAAAVIAGALFGFTGQGMQWLQRLDGLVEADIQQQAQELQRKGGLLGKQIDVQNNLVAMARQQGLDEAESISAARIAMMNKYATMFEQAAATTGSEAVKTQALANSAILREKMARDMMDMKLKTTEAAQKAALTAAQVNHLNAQTFAIGTKTASDARESQTFKPAQQERISEMLSLGKKIGEMHGKWREQAGSPVSPLTSRLGLGMQATDASKWKGSTQKFFAQVIGKPLEGGRMTDADFPKYLEGFIPSADDTKGAAENKTRNLVKYAKDRYTDELRSLYAANVQGLDRLPTPEQYEMMLLQESGISQDAPSYATPR